MNVEQPAAAEEKRVTRQRGLARNREILYERDGVYAAWRDVFGQYVALARERGSEALKRTLFFVRAECSISHLLTGIKDLGAEMARETLGVADEWVRDARLDAQLQWICRTTTGRVLEDRTGPPAALAINLRSRSINPCRFSLKIHG